MVDGTNPLGQDTNDLISRHENGSPTLGPSEKMESCSNGQELVQQNTIPTSMLYTAQWRGNILTQEGTYTCLEMLSDSIATLLRMPAKIQRVSCALAGKLNDVEDIKTLTEFVDKLLETCLTENKFRPIAGRFSHNLMHEVNLNFTGITFSSLLLDKIVDIGSNPAQIVLKDRVRFRSLMMYSTDLYLQFYKGNNPASNNIQDSKLDSEEKENQQQILARILYELYLAAVNSKDTIHLKTLVDMLKLTGKSLEDQDRFCGKLGKTSQLNKIMEEIDKIYKNECEDYQDSGELRKSLAGVLRIRALNWKVEETDRPTLFDVPQTSGSFLNSTKKSNAIKSVKPLADPTFGDQETSRTKPSFNFPAEQVLTEEELSFMDEQVDEVERLFLPDHGLTEDELSILDKKMDGPTFADQETSRTKPSINFTPAEQDLTEDQLSFLDEQIDQLEVSFAAKQNLTEDELSFLDEKIDELKYMNEGQCENEDARINR